MKRILVTGGMGFIGSHLCETLLSQGHYVICIDNHWTGRWDNISMLLEQYKTTFQWIEHDVLDSCMELPVVEEIYHVACPASPKDYQSDPIRTWKTSVLGTWNILEFARFIGARLLFTSTSEVYGDPTQNPQSEHYWGNVNPVGIRSCYDEGKRAAECLLMDAYREYGIEVRIARIFNTYGPRLRIDDGRVVSNLIVQALRGEPMTLYGNGSQTRSFCYITDLISGLLKLMASDYRFPMNLGNPHEITIAELAETIRRMVSSSSPIVFQALPEDDPCCRNPNIEKAQDYLGWKPTLSIEEGLQRTIAYMRDKISS